MPGCGPGLVARPVSSILTRRCATPRIRKRCWPRTGRRIIYTSTTWVFRPWLIACRWSGSFEPTLIVPEGVERSPWVGARRDNIGFPRDTGLLIGGVPRETAPFVLAAHGAQP